LFEFVVGAAARVNILFADSNDGRVVNSRVLLLYCVKKLLSHRAILPMERESAAMQVVAISGSPSPTSKTAMLAELILRHLQVQGISVRHHRISAIAPEILLRGVTSDAVLAGMIADLEAAHGIIIATPIYKASYSGMLKCFLDILPQFALAGKAILPVGTGGSVAHVLALDYALRPVLQSMGARHIVQSHFVPEAGMRMEGAQVTIVDGAASPLWEAVRHFTQALSDDPQSRSLGHPRPAEA
jgi:FMN reductase